MTDLGTKVFYRASTADGSTISMAFATGGDDTIASLAVKPDQAPWFDAPSVARRGTEEEGAACWSAWITELQPTA